MSKGEREKAAAWLGCRSSFVWGSCSGPLPVILGLLSWGSTSPFICPLHPYLPLFLHSFQAPASFVVPEQLSAFHGVHTKLFVSLSHFFPVKKFSILERNQEFCSTVQKYSKSWGTCFAMWPSLVQTPVSHTCSSYLFCNLSWAQNQGKSNPWSLPGIALLDTTHHNPTPGEKRVWSRVGASK